MFDKIQNQLDWLFNASLGEIINQFIISIQESFQNIIMFFGDGAEKLITLRYLDLSFTQTIFTIFILAGMRYTFKEEFQRIDADKLLFERIKQRAEEGEFVRNDDNKDVLIKRITVYQKDTMPVLEYYRSLKRLKTVDGMQSIENVSSDIKKMF